MKATHHSVLWRIDKEADDGLFAKRLSGLQPVQTLNEYEARAVHPYQDRRLQALVENACRDLFYSLLFEGGTPLNRNVDVGDCDGLTLHHDRTKPATFPPDYVGSLAAFFYLAHQYVEQRLSLFEVKRVEPIRKPPVDRSEWFVGLQWHALVAPESAGLTSASET
jgi:hypothetical protein